MARKPGKKNLFADVVETAVEFHKRRLWNHLDPNRPIAVAVEGEEHPVLCFVLGKGGSGLGLSALRGEGAIEGFEHVVLTGDNFDVDSPCDMLMLSFMTLSGVNPEYLRILEQSGRVFGRLSTAPLFMSCLLYTSPSPRDRTRSRMPSSA